MEQIDKIDYRIKSLKVKDFKGAKDITLNFHPKMNVLIGENGSGKTSVLEALAHFFNQLEVMLYSNKVILPELAIPDGGYIMCELDDNDTKKIDQQEFDELKEDEEAFDKLLKDGLEKRLEKLNSEYKEINERASGRSGEKKISAINSQKLADIDEEIKKTTSIISNLDSNRVEALELVVRQQIHLHFMMPQVTEDDAKLVGDSEKRMRTIADFLKFSESTDSDIVTNGIFFAAFYVMKNADRTDKYDSTLSIGLSNAWDHALDKYPFDYKYFFEWFQWIHRQKERTPQQGDAIENIKKAILRFMNSGSGEEVYRSVEFDDSKFGKPELVIKKGDHSLWVSQMSSGERAIFALIADMARRFLLAYPNSDHPLDELAFIMIDEIDLHLHPRLQKDLLVKMSDTFPNCQFFISTHSPVLVFSASEPSMIHVLKDGYNDYIDDKINGRHLPSFLLDHFGFEHTPLFFHTRIEFLREQIQGFLKEYARESKYDEVKELKAAFVRDLDKFGETWQADDQKQSIAELIKMLDEV